MSPRSGRPPKQNRPQRRTYSCSCGAEFQSLLAKCPFESKNPGAIHEVSTTPESRDGRQR
jgi:hypothetical protein